jgi:hypothetical protein
MWTCELVVYYSYFTMMLAASVWGIFRYRSQRNVLVGFVSFAVGFALVLIRFHHTHNNDLVSVSSMFGLGMLSLLPDHGRTDSKPPTT